MGNARILSGAGAAAALATLGLVVSGCGSSSPSAASAAATTTSSSSTTIGTATAPTTTTGRGRFGGASSAAFTAFQSCLKAHGVTIAGGGFGGFGRRANGGAPTGTGAPPAGTTRTGPTRTGTTQTGTTPRRPGGFAGGGFGRTLTAKQQAAFTLCQSKLPAGARGGAGGFRRGGTGAGGANGNPAFAKYTACLAKHGVKFGTSSAGSTTFAKAQAACRSLLPTPGGGTTTTTTG